MAIIINADTSNGLKLTSDTSGTIDFQSNGVTKMSMDANGNLNTVGRVTKTSQPAFKATVNTDMNNFSTSYTNIIFDTESFDVGSNFNTGTYTFTAPADGRYLFTATLGMKALPVDAEWFILQIVTTNNVISDSRSTAQWDANTNSGRVYSFKCVGIVDLDANDTAYVRFYQYTGTAQADANISHVYTQFTGILLG